jgi:hypothetical protein
MNLAISQLDPLDSDEIPEELCGVRLNATGAQVKRSPAPLFYGTKILLRITVHVTERMQLPQTG